MKELVIIIGLVSVVVVIVLLYVILVLINKKSYREAEHDLLKDITDGNGVDIEVLKMVSMTSLRDYGKDIADANVKILEEYFYSPEYTPQECLEVIDQELLDINSLQNEKKKKIVYNLFLESCCNLDLRIWLPIFANLILYVQEEDCPLKNLNDVYNFMVDIIINFEPEELKKTFTADCLMVLREQEECLSEETWAQIEDALNDLVNVAEETAIQNQIVKVM